MCVLMIMVERHFGKIIRIHGRNAHIFIDMSIDST